MSFATYMRLCPNWRESRLLQRMTTGVEAKESVVNIGNLFPIMTQSENAMTVGSYGPKTLSTDGRPDTPSAMSSGVDSITVRHSIARGLQYLSETFEDWGGWSDFSTRSSGQSTTWITAYVLIRAGKLIPANHRKSALEFLIKNQSDSGGWGFSESTPSDCDSTAHALAACVMFCDETNPFLDSGLHHALRFLRKHLRVDGGFSTYCSASTLSSYRYKRNESDYGGWLSSHTCTTANVLSALDMIGTPESQELTGTIPAYFLKEQADDGLWEAYWWRSRVFVATELLPRLVKLVPTHLRERVLRGVPTILQGQHPSGYWDNGIDENVPCLISTAMCVKMLFELRTSVLRLSEGCRFLISAQEQNGAWRGRELMQIPMPNDRNPWQGRDWRMGGRGVGSCCFDEKGIYTTATVLACLATSLGES